MYWQTAYLKAAVPPRFLGAGTPGKARKSKCKSGDKSIRKPEKCRDTKHWRSAYLKAANVTQVSYGAGTPEGKNGVEDYQNARGNIPLRDGNERTTGETALEPNLFSDSLEKKNTRHQLGKGMKEITLENTPWDIRAGNHKRRRMFYTTSIPDFQISSVRWSWCSHVRRDVLDPFGSMGYASSLCGLASTSKPNNKQINNNSKNVNKMWTNWHWSHWQRHPLQDTRSLEAWTRAEQA